MSKTDRIILFLLALLGIALFLPPFFRAQGGPRVVQVEVDGRIWKEFSLPPPGAPPRRVKVPLARGEAVLSFERGGVRILPLPRKICPRGICSHSGLIRRAGESLVCVPNRLVVRIIASGRAADFDAVAR